MFEQTLGENLTFLSIPQETLKTQSNSTIIGYFLAPSSDYFHAPVVNNKLTSHVAMFLCSCSEQVTWSHLFMIIKFRDLAPDLRE